MLDPDRLEAIAEDLGAIQRKRDAHAGVAVCAWILSAFERSTYTEGRQLDARRTYEQIGGRLVKKTTFREHSIKLVPVFEELLRRASARWLERSPPALRGRLARFTDVLVPDGCAFKLAQALAGVYSGTGQPAEIKLHAIYSVRHGTATRVATSAGAVHDSDGLPAAAWERGALYLWDLGFNDYGRFVEAQTAGSHVVQRLKDKANPIVLASYGPAGQRRKIHDEGRALTLDEACSFEFVPTRGVLDLDIELRAGRKRIVARVVRVSYEGEEHWYLTTLPRALFSPYDIAEIYRIRWECELFFRSWKGAVRLDEVRRLSDPKALQVALLSSLLASLLSTEIHAAIAASDPSEASLEQPADPGAAFPPLRPARPRAAATRSLDTRAHAAR